MKGRNIGKSDRADKIRRKNYEKVKIKEEDSHYYSDKFMPIVHDERPVEGEYWQSRGPSDWDVSGFVRSKAAGERLRRMVRLVLEKDETKSWLDWRETEPEWIQFKFSAEEFDVEKLHNLSKQYDGVLTINILKECIKK